MYTVYDIHYETSTHNWNGAEWIVDGERGRYSYPPTMTKEEVRKAYSEGK